MTRATRRKLRRLVDRLEYLFVYSMMAFILIMLVLFGIQFICKYSDGFIEVFQAFMDYFASL